MRNPKGLSVISGIYTLSIRGYSNCKGIAHQMNPSSRGAGPEGVVTAENVDLSNCDRELIQYSGAVQPHTALIAVLEPELKVVQLSANTPELIGFAPDDLLDRPLADLLGAAQMEQLRRRLARETLVNVPPVHVLRAEISGKHFHVFAHRIDPLLLLEWEAIHSELPAVDLYSQVPTTIARLQTAPTLQSFFEEAVREISEITGFDRVMAYEFLPDGSGRVTAEVVSPGLEPYLGLHYPASDIPQPARRLFSLTWLRHLPNVDYTPAPLIPAANPITHGPLDLSYVAGRHVSVMYSQYLQNMGVKATMVMTLLKNGQLWGLISCMNHAAPMHVPYESRMACEFLAHMVSLLMAAKQDVETYEQRLRTDATLDHLIEQVARAKDIGKGLMCGNPNLLAAVPAGGAALLSGGRVVSAGITPPETQIRELGGWLSSREEAVFATDRLGELYEPGTAFRTTGSGVLAARLARSSSEFVMWFRPELAETVHWAGDPHKPVEISRTDMETRLSPRTSFAIWKEDVRGRSAPWQDYEVEAARSFRHALMEIVIERAAELERINRELEKSNEELDSFAYVASHDLKEPLRGIHNYSAMLRRSAGEKLSDEETARLETVLRLTQRMDDLIEGLLQYARVGRTEFSLQSVDLNDVVRASLDLLRLRIDQPGVEIAAATLPSVTGDGIRLREVFCNLIANALKYNDNPEKRVEIGYRDGSPPVFHVRDNGIGITPEHLEDIFQIFRRLHSRDEYGGGTGAGLTIARRTVERHGGRMWVESTPGKGSTFYFTLMAAATSAAPEMHP